VAVRDGQLIAKELICEQFAVRELDHQRSQRCLQLTGSALARLSSVSRSLASVR
jgi:hypothetical protein